MSRPYPRRVPVSGVPPAADVSHPDRSGPFDVPDRKRYSAGGLLGRGGMGEVRSALDSRLGRVVARKTARGDDPSVARALVDEARLASRLNHPSILAVLDAGRSADGSLYYTMPVVHGRTLARTIGDAPDLDRRLRLVRHFLDLVDAVAYAHSQGVLHRDLKPSNVLVGEYGETILVDWGLAATLEDAALPGSPAGTPGYASPEQEAGLPLDERSDLYSLGATLYGIVAGVPPAEDHLEPLADLAPDCPPELLAIVDKAMAGDPGARYPYARALAEDVAAWFEGRRVGAYRYTTWELLARAVRANKPAFLLLLGSVVVVAIVAGLSYRRTVAERDRARVAETEAVTARAQSDMELHRALVAQGLVAASLGRRAHAEVLASQALAIAEAPDARGVLSRFGGRPRPDRLQSVPTPDCVRRSFSWDGARVACVARDEIRIYEPGLSPDPIARHAVDAANVVFAGDRLLVTSREDRGVLVIDEGPPLWLAPDARQDPIVRGSVDRSWGLAIDNGTVFLLDLERRTEQMLLPPCPGRLHAQATALLPGGREFLVACSDGTIHRIDTVDNRGTRLAVLPPGYRAVTNMSTFLDDPERVLLSTASSEVYYVDLRTGDLLRRFASGAANVASFAGAGELVAVSTFAGDVTVWRVDRNSLVATLPSEAAAVFVQGDVVRVAGESVTDWGIGSPGRVRHIPGVSGIAAIAISPDGRMVATARGSGDLRIHDTRTGDLLWTDRRHESVAKDVVFSPDGTLFAATYAGEQAAHVYTVDGWDHVRMSMQWNFRRAAFPVDGQFVAVPYGPGDLMVFDYPPGGRPDGSFRRLTLGPSNPLDVEGIPGTGQLAAYLRDGELIAIDGDVVRRIAKEPGGNIARGGRWIALVYRWGFTLYSLDGEERRGEIGGGIPFESALSPDGRYLAIGFGDGLIQVWSTEEPRKVAQLRGHTAQLSALVFGPKGEWLYSGSWDADIRAWSMAELDADPIALTASLGTAWGMSLEGALAP